MATNSGLSVTPSSRRSRRSGLVTKSSQNTSFSWITRNEDDELQVSSLDHLDISSCEFVNFVTILGPARQGKSFLMNCLIGEEVFDIADTMSVCTKGAEIANVVHYVPEKEGCALFVDTEGQGDHDVDSDATLLTPVLLLSKVVLFNWKGGLQKNQILNELAILVEVGNCVSAHSFEEGTAKFGHLHIVLRDFHFQGTEDEAYNKIFEPEEKRGEKIKERNKIREKLLSSFESVDVSIFPAPCDTSNEEIGDLDFLKTSGEFQESVRQLKKKIVDQMGEPRYLGNTVVHCVNANFFVEKFVEELQEGDVVHLKSVVAQFQKGIVDNAKRSFEEALVEAYKKIDVPVRDGIDGILMQQKDALLDAFEEFTAKVDVATIHRDEVLEGLDEFSIREIEAKRRENLLAIKSREAEQKQVLSKVVREFRSAVEDELRRSEGASSEKMRQDFEKRKKRLDEKFHESADDLDWIPEFVEEELVLLTTWASSRLKEKIEAKQNEEAYLEKSKQQDQLWRAAEDFRSGVESELRRNRQINSQGFCQEFQGELERLLQAFQQNCKDDTGRITELAKEAMEQLRRWATKRMEEKYAALQEEEQVQQRLQAAEQMELMSRQREQQQLLFDSPSYQSPPVPSSVSYSSPASSTGHSISTSYPEEPVYEVDSVSGLKFYKGGQFTPGGGRAPAGGCYMPPPSGGSSRSSSSLSSSSGGSKFYKGGQFTPGGGRAPAGGYYMSPPSGGSSRSSSSMSSSSGGSKFYKGGQFTPGGGRAPAGGCSMSPPSGGSSRSSSSRSSSSGGSKFYKGGQFMPGGGRAPKGGSRK